MPEAVQTYIDTKDIRQVVSTDKTWKVEGRIVYLPIYMLHCLKPTALPEKMIFEI